MSRAMTKRDYDKRVIETKGSVLVCRWEGCFIDLEYDACHYNATDWLLIRETVTVCVRRVSLPARAQRQLTDMTWLRHMPNYWHISRWWHGRNIFPQWQSGVHKQLFCLDLCHQLWNFITSIWKHCLQLTPPRIYLQTASSITGL